MRAIPQHAAAPYMQVRGAVSPNTHRQISRQRSGRRLGCLGVVAAVVVVCSNTLTREARQKKIRCKPMHFRSVRPGHSFVRFRPEFDGDVQGIANGTTSLWGNCESSCAMANASARTSRTRNGGFPTAIRRSTPPRMYQNRPHTRNRPRQFPGQTDQSHRSKAPWPSTCHDLSLNGYCFQEGEAAVRC